MSFDGPNQCIIQCRCYFLIEACPFEDFIVHLTRDESRWSVAPTVENAEDFLIMMHHWYRLRCKFCDGTELAQVRTFLVRIGSFSKTGPRLRARDASRMRVGAQD